MSDKVLDATGLSYFWSKIKSFFVKGNARVFYGTCDTAGGTSDKVVVCPSFTSADLIPGTIVSVLFSNANTAAIPLVNLNVNNTGQIYTKIIINGRPIDIPYASYIAANSIVQFVYDGTYWVAQSGIETDTVGAYSGDCLAGVVGIYRYALTLKISEQEWESVVRSSSTGTSKTKNPNKFLLDSPMVVVDNQSYPSGQKTLYNHTFLSTIIDTRYSANTGSMTWSQRTKPFYLKGNVVDDGGVKKFQLADNTWWASSLPSSNDGFYYWYVGNMINEYQCCLSLSHPIYYHDGSKIRTYVIGGEKYAKADEVKGYAEMSMSGKSVTSTSMVELSGFTTAFSNSNLFENSSGYLKIKKAGLYLVALKTIWSATANSTNVKAIAICQKDAPTSWVGDIAMTRAGSYEVSTTVRICQIAANTILSFSAREEGGNGTANAVATIVPIDVTI